MIYIVTKSAEVYREECEDRGLNPRDNHQIQMVSNMEKAYGLRPSKSDEVVMGHNTDFEALKYLRDLQDRT